MESIEVRFVLQSELNSIEEASDLMHQTFEACSQHIKKVSWIKEQDIPGTSMQKTDIFVFDKFEGEAFDTIKKTKAVRIVGPWVIMVCLMEGKSIPNYPWPIYNVAMYGTNIASSHLPKDVKAVIKEHVLLMGGHYTDMLQENNTHLVTDSVMSEKYSVAAEKGFKIMLPNWIDAVWQKSQTANVHCDDDEFSQYKCPPFHKLNICITGFNNINDRETISNLVTKHGGIYSAKLQTNKTDVLVCNGIESTSSEKYKAARKHNIKCVSIDWLHESISKGCQMPHNLYTFKKGTSTPKKGDELNNPDFSIMSAITITEHKSSINETVIASGSSQKRKNAVGEYDEIINGLNLKDVKRAGQFLDGCNVCVVGFNPVTRDKLCKILNLSGATRFDEVTDNVTHVIVGDPGCHEMNVIRNRGYSCRLVTFNWVLESLEAKHAVSEDKFLVSNVEKNCFNSPLSKKGLKFLRTNSMVTEMEVDAASENLSYIPPPLEEEEVFKQYLPTNGTNAREEDTLDQLLKNDHFKEPSKVSKIQVPEEHSTGNTETMTEDSEMTSLFLQGYKFILTGIPRDDFVVLKEDIESYGGLIVGENFKGIADFAITPVFNKHLQAPAAEKIVNVLWLLDCIKDESIVPFMKYHEPFILPNGLPLKDCVVTLSGINGKEREFFKSLIESLGGIAQEQFSRVRKDAKNILGSTHLVTLEPSGKKYEAALQWGIPAVSKDWLMKCLETGVREAEDDFLIATYKAPADNKTDIETTNTTTFEKKSFCNPGTPQSSKQDKFLTPRAVKHSSINENDISLTANAKYEDHTPKNVRHKRTDNFTPGRPCSQVTPVSKIMEDFRKADNFAECVTPKQNTFWNIKTPETPLENFCCNSPNKEVRKAVQRFLNQLPDYVPPVERRKSTPLSELKMRLFKKFVLNTEDNEEQERKDESLASALEKENQENEPDIENSSINNKLLQLEEALSTSGGKRKSRAFQSTMTSEMANMPLKDSQAFSVKWDYRETEEMVVDKPKVFMLTNMNPEDKQIFINKLESLGGVVSDCASYDPNGTHLICNKPIRNEKTLGCMAAGKWILHNSYVDACVAAGMFIDEEEFEFGNPKASKNIGLIENPEEKKRALCMHKWRKEISKRGYGAFNDLRVILICNKKEQIAKVIEAGGGVMVDASPPFDAPVHATHCLMELRNIPQPADYIPLAKQGIYCVATRFLNDFLVDEVDDVKKCILPYFAKYFPN